VALHRFHSEDPVGGGGDLRVTDLGSEHRLIEHGVEQIAHGAMVCPTCAKPVAIEATLGVGDELECGWCEASGPARSYLVRDVFDTPANEVFLIARIG
jgi:hypothetical protein